MNLKTKLVIVMLTIMLASCSRALSPYQAAFGTKCGQKLK